GLRRPRHQFAVEYGPVARQPIPAARPFHRVRYDVEDLAFETIAAGKKSATGAREDDTAPLVGHPETAAGNRLVATDNDNGPRAHVLLLAYHGWNIRVPVISERFGRIFEIARLAGRLRRRHRGRQIDEPLRIHG